MLCSLLSNRSTPPSFKIIIVNLIGHHHHPQQKHAPDQIHGERGLPIITNPLRRHIRERGLPVLQAAGGAVHVAVHVDAALGPVELDRGLDQAGQEEDEEDEGAEHDNPGEELPLLDETQDYEEEDEADAPGGDAVGEEPVGKRGVSLIGSEGWG